MALDCTKILGVLVGARVVLDVYLACVKVQGHAVLGNSRQEYSLRLCKNSEETQKRQK